MFCATIFTISPAIADRADDAARTCASAAGNAAISACSWGIKSGRWKGDSRARALNNRGVAYFGLRQYDRALRDYSQAIALKPDYAEALNNRGNAYNGLGQYARAVADLDRAVALRPGYAHAFYNRGNAYVSLGQFRNAVQDYSSAITLKPGYANAYGGRCWARAALNLDLSLALVDCSTFLAHKPNDADTLDSRGLVFYRMGNLKPAIADTTAALAVNPRLASSRYVRGLAKLKSGDEIGGNADLATARAIDRKIALTYAAYGVNP